MVEYVKILLGFLPASAVKDLLGIPATEVLVLVPEVSATPAISHRCEWAQLDEITLIPR